MGAGGIMDAGQEGSERKSRDGEKWKDGEHIHFFHSHDEGKRFYTQ